MELVVEISSGEDDLLIIKPKQSSRKKKFHNKNYTWRRSLHSKLFFNVFLANSPPKVSLYYGTNFRKKLNYTWASVNIVVRKNSSKAWKNISLTSAITTILSIKFLRLCQKSSNIRVFIFEESLTNFPRGIVSEKYNRCINVLKRGDH